MGKQIFTVPGAKELSGLLQGVKTSADQDSITKTTTITTIPLSKLLTSTSTTTAISEKGGTEYLASVVKEGQGEEDKGTWVATQGGSGTHKILLKARTSSPFTIPLSMAQKLVNGSPLLHITSTSTTPTQIHQLLSSVSKASPISPMGKTILITSENITSSANSPILSLASSKKTPVTVFTPKVISSSQKLKTVALVSPSPDQKKVKEIQRLQFHDFPLTTATLSKLSGSSSVTQAKILGSSQQSVGNITTKSASVIAGNKSLINPGTLTIPLSAVASKAGTHSPVLISSSDVGMYKIQTGATSMSTVTTPSISQLGTSSARSSLVVTISETIGKVQSVLESSPSLTPSVTAAMSVGTGSYTLGTEEQRFTTLSVAPSSSSDHLKTNSLVQLKSDSIVTTASLKRESPVISPTVQSAISQMFEPSIQPVSSVGPASTELGHHVTSSEYFTDSSLDNSTSATVTSSVQWDCPILTPVVNSGSSEVTASVRSFPKPTSSSSTTSKPILRPIASTRTRRIKTPKQYDL